MQLFYQPGAAHVLDEEESRHCVKVLRKQKGDIIQIVDGKGNFYEARIEDDHPKRCAYSVQHTTHVPPRPFSIHIAIAPTKSIDRLEWFVEKSVEIGVEKITPIWCQNSERTRLRTDRLERKAISAMKQSEKAWLPSIAEAQDFKQFIGSMKEKEAFIAHQHEDAAHLTHTAKPGFSCCVLIGPEGDFTDEEMAMATQAGVQMVGLGPSRLRTETAALVACTILNMINSVR
jgi:16S rRNA (uracil1498-N3)-methyltransferase